LIYITSFIPSERVGRLDHDGGVVGWWPKDGPYVAAIEVPRYTASIDAALAWVGLVLPDDFVRIEQLTRSRWQVHLEGSEGVSWANAPTPALAIILAALETLIAKRDVE
jgi:hypothetical protein